MPDAWYHDGDTLLHLLRLEQVHSCSRISIANRMLERGRIPQLRGSGGPITNGIPTGRIRYAGLTGRR